MPPRRGFPRPAPRVFAAATPVISVLSPSRQREAAFSLAFFASYLLPRAPREFTPEGSVADVDSVCLLGRAPRVGPPFWPAPGPALATSQDQPSYDLPRLFPVLLRLLEPQCLLPRRSLVPGSRRPCWRSPALQSGTRRVRRWTAGTRVGKAPPRPMPT